MLKMVLFKKNNKIWAHHKPLFIILGVLLALKLALYKIFYTIFWDEAVYDGMAKFIYSAGEKGFLEVVRPIGLSLISGLFWKAGLGIVAASRITVTLSQIGLVVLVYLIAEKLFSRKSAIFAAFAIAINPLILFWSTKGYNEITAAFFALLAVYLFMKKKFAMSGASMAFSFICRFPLAFLLLPIALFFCWSCASEEIKKRKFPKNAVLFAAGGIAVLALYLLLFNKVYYQNILSPFLAGFESRNWTGGSFLLKKDGWIYIETLAIFLNASLIMYLSACKKAIIKKNAFIIAVFIIAPAIMLIFHQLFGLVEERYLIPIFPFMIILASSVFKKNSRWARAAVIATAAVSVAMLLICYFATNNPFSQEMYLSADSNVLRECPKELAIASSSPLPVVERDRVYFYYGEHNNKMIEEHIETIKCFMFLNCDFTGNIPPAPIKNLSLVYSNEKNYCKFYVFSNDKFNSTVEDNFLIIG
jgi:4-amino-4-deoxy-L-arabinose transferase-like glycosyltransferase